MQIVLILTVAVAFALIGFALGRYLGPDHRAALEAAHEKVAQMDEECNTLRSRATELVSENKALSEKGWASSEEVARLTERVVGLSTQAGEHGRQTAALEAQREAAANEAKAAAAESARLGERVASLTRQTEEQTKHSKLIEAQRESTAEEAKAAAAESARLAERLKEREAALTDKIETQAAQLADQQKKLTTEFENIANRILKANATELSETSQRELSSILEPLRERIHEFQTKVETTYTAENREVLSLKEQIRLILETSHAIGNQADGLAKALRGDSQLLGRWGELALERILEAAGLTEGREYVSQGRGLSLKNESGGIQRPDVIVKLPEQRTMVIDSKVPLASYERLIAASDQEERALCADLFVKDLKWHIDDLANKRYQENEKLLAHDCVLMFMPIEGALAAALTRDPELFVYAWERHVVIVGPPTLLMTMRTVASIWRYELQTESTQEIARLAGELCDKVSMSLADLNGVAEKISEAMAAHSEAIKRLSTGKGNALSIGQRLQSLGVKTKKLIPSMIIDDAPLALPSEDLVESASSDAGEQP